MVFFHASRETQEGGGEIVGAGLIVLHPPVEEMREGGREGEREGGREGRKMSLASSTRARDGWMEGGREGTHRSNP